MVTRAQLAIALSQMSAFDSPKVHDEQYITDSETAATMLWDAYTKDRLIGKTYADMGAGTGILGIGAALLGAKKVYFVEKDADALKVLKENLELLEDEIKEKCILVHQNIKEFDPGEDVKIDVVIQNPPFGTREIHADRDFLMKAFNIADCIYSLHKSTSDTFMNKLTSDNGFKVVERIRINMPVKSTFKHHTRKIKHIDVTCYHLERA